jgi:uncharacterized membrane protein YgdD (TMEM256/DUF423 family)
VGSRRAIRAGSFAATRPPIDNSGMTERGGAVARSRAERILVGLSGAYGALAVALGAYGAHGLERVLEGAPDAAARLAWWKTAALYHLTHALALGLTAWLSSRGRGAVLAGALFAIGVAIFSGTLYAMTLGAPRWLGAITPLGGLSLIAGWILVLVCALRR